MKYLFLGALFCASLPLMAQKAAADPMQDVCHTRAYKVSGHDGRRTGLTAQAGGVQMRLSGSVALGVSRSSGAQGSNASRPFAGSAATERREQDAQGKYQRIYDDCMRTR